MKGLKKFLAHGVLALVVMLHTALIACGGGEQGADLSAGSKNGDGDGDGDGDEDAESCDDLDCQDNASCREALGKATCECEEGFTLDDDDDCVDVDECDDDDLNSCDDNASCENTDGGFDCECDDGYEGDGFTCEEEASCDPDEEECPGEGPCPSGQIGEDEDSCHCDLSGYWAVRQDVSFTVPKQELDPTSVFIRESVTNASLWELYRYDYDGSVIKVKKKGCGSDIYPLIVSPLFEESYSVGIPFHVFDDMELQDGADIPIEADKALPGEPFVTPSEAALLGIEMEDPLNDPWPEPGTVDADAWVDSDGDGQPGLTLWSAEPDCPDTDRPALEETICYTPVEQREVAGAITIISRTPCVSVGTRVITHQEAEITACTRIAGDMINEKTQFRLQGCVASDERNWDTPLDCDPSIWRDLGVGGLSECTEEQIIGFDEQDQTQYVMGTFEAIKLTGLDADDVDCAMVRERLPAIERD